MRIAFWASVVVVFYVYVGYPALLAAWARLGSRRVARRELEEAELPGLSIVIAARNEARHLPTRLDNLLACDYPAHLVQIIVVSDGSTDATPEVLAKYAGRVEAIPLPRGGKAVALNAGVARARHDVLVFADARQVYAPDALRHLVANFADPRVGGVSGELVLDCEGQPNSPLGGESSIGEGVGLYWQYEKWLRTREGAVGSTLGATGAIYALRRQLWQVLPADTILDDVLAPMRAVLAGYRVVFEPRARAFDRAAADGVAEARRKVRTLAGNYQLLRLDPRLLIPVINPVWLQYVSHKLGRLVVPYALMVLFVASVALSRSGVLYAAAAVAQAIFYLLAAWGAVLDARARRAPRRPGTPAAARPQPAATPAPADWSARATPAPGRGGKVLNA